jgi:hypothetical protein
LKIWGPVPPSRAFGLCSYSLPRYSGGGQGWGLGRPGTMRSTRASGKQKIEIRIRIESKFKSKSRIAAVTNMRMKSPHD